MHQNLFGRSASGRKQVHKSRAMPGRHDLCCIAEGALASSPHQPRRLEVQGGKLHLHNTEVGQRGSSLPASWISPPASALPETALALRRWL